MKCWVRKLVSIHRRSQVSSANMERKIQSIHGNGRAKQTRIGEIGPRSAVRPRWMEERVASKWPQSRMAATVILSRSEGGGVPSVSPRFPFDDDDAGKISAAGGMDRTVEVECSAGSVGRNGLGRDS